MFYEYHVRNKVASGICGSMIIVEEALVFNPATPERK